MRLLPQLDDIVPYEPGLPIELVMRRFGLSDVVKLASNEFPLSPFDEVRATIVAALADLNRYPDGHSADLRAALAAHYGRAEDEVAVGNGTYELLLLLGDAVLQPGSEVVFGDPSFGAYEHTCLRHGATPVKVPLIDFTHDLEAMAAAETPRTRMLLVCNPNNPTGTYVPAAGIAELVERVDEDVLIVLDEAYNEFVTAADSQDSLALQAAHPNVVILRTFSKIYGLCGLRLGYGLCSPEIKKAIDKLRQPFNVSRVAQAAGVEALKHQDLVEQRTTLNAEVRSYMVERLAAAGRATVPSQANFMLVDVRALSVPLERVFETLLAQGAIVRDGAAIGCPGWVRVTVGTRAETDFFLEKLAALDPACGTTNDGRTN